MNRQPSVKAPAKRAEKRIARRRETLRAASEIFRSKGYRGTSVNAIVDRVGGSKRNFYAEFGNKEGLFKALVTSGVSNQGALLTFEDRSDCDLRSRLIRAVNRFVANIGDSEAVGLYRIILSEGLCFPEIVTAFFEVALGGAEEYIENVLKDAAAKEEIPEKDYKEEAISFVSMLHRKLFYELLFNTKNEFVDREVEALVFSSVDIFLNGIVNREPCRN